MKPFRYSFSAFCRLAVLLTVLVSVSPATALSFPARGVVNHASVNLRRSPGSGAERIGKLSSGDRVTVTGTEEDGSGAAWYAVSCSKGSGYILGEYLSVADEERIQAASASGEAVMMNVSVNAVCANYHGLGKTWSRLFEINGLPLPEKGLAVTLAPDVPFTLFSSLKSQSGKARAAGVLDSVYTPGAEEIVRGFSVVQTLTAVNKNGKEAVWTVTFSFVPAGAVPLP